MATSLRRKRRPPGDCPNPLFLKWIEEWRDEAREEGSKVQYAYTKALNSLKKYPLPLVSGQEAKILDHIGEKLAKKLDKKLAQYRVSEGGTARSPTKRPKVAWQSGNGDETTSTVVKRKPSRNEYVPEYRSGPYAIIVALYNAQQKPSWRGHLTKAQLMCEAQPHSDKSFTIPDDGKYYTAWSSTATLIRKGLVDKRSCPAKFRLTETGEEMAEKLVRASSSLIQSSPPVATPLPSSSPPLTADAMYFPSSSAAASDDRDATYKKSSGCVMKGSSSPKLYRATSSGSCRVCVQPPTLRNTSQDDMDSDDDVPRISLARHPQPTPTKKKKCHSKTKSSSSSSASSPLSCVTSGVNSTAATVSEVPVTLISDSDDDGSGSSAVEILPLASRMRAKTQSKNPPSMSSPPDNRPPWSVAETPMRVVGGARDRENVGSDEGGGGEGRWKGGERSLTEAARGPVTPAQMAGQAALRRSQKKLPSHVGKRTRVARTGRRSPCKVDLTGGEGKSHEKEEFPEFNLNPSLSQTKPASISLHQIHTSPLPSRTCDTNSIGCAAMPPPSSTLPPLHSGTTANTIHTSSRPTKLRGAVSHSEQGTGPSMDLTRPLFQLKPDEFDVVLCVDNAESTASRKLNSQFRGILLQELAKNGVLFDVRKLNVGDFLWIAREKTKPLPGQLTLPQSREAVLEYIVERKRMDDLSSSITDGRFREQKFRLRHSGVKCPMYLVEEFKDALHLKLKPRTLEQAISNVQVIDGFTVHRTTDVRDSVAYLTLLTRQLQHHYTGKTVQGFPWDTIAQLNESTPEMTRPGSTDTARLREKRMILAMEFTSFNEASVKNKTLSAYEMFGRHLMQVPGISADRAAVILDHFPTITALRDAYKMCQSDSEREALVTNLKAGQNRRLGVNIGRLMCCLYWRQ